MANLSFDLDFLNVTDSLIPEPAPRNKDYHSTNSKSTDKVRAWVFTINNYTDIDELHLSEATLSSAVKYILYGKETAPTTGTPHLQGYIVFNTTARRSQVKLILGEKAWFSPAKGNFAQNFDYCTKSGDFCEYGTRPKSQSDGGKKSAEEKKRKWDEAATNAKAGLIEAIDSEIFIRHYNQLKNIARDYQPKPADLPADLDKVGIWYVGLAGTGKSYAAINDYPNAFRKTANTKWWCGYQDEDYVILDDLDKTHHYMGFHLKIWADKYAFNAEIKGTSKLIRPKKIIVTSNVHPRDIWTEDHDINPILRRFHIVWFKRDDNDIIHWDVNETRKSYTYI